MSAEGRWVSRLGWIARRRAGTWAMWGGVALVLASLALQWLVIAPLEQRIGALESARSGRDARLASAGQTLERSGGARAQLAGFYGHFERSDGLTDLLAKLHVAGKQAGLEVRRAEYRMSSPPDRRLDRYQIVMPIRGSYPAIRAFIANALRELPTLSLDQVQFQRKEVGDPIVDAQLSFSIHLAR